MRPSEPAANARPGGSRPADHPATAPAPPASEAAVLESALSRFLVDLSIALHRFAMYPPGHPSLAVVLETLGRRAEALLQDRPKIAVGVARDRLVIEGVVTDARHALLCALADRLHRHHLSALAFHRGVTMRELGALVNAIAEDPNGDAGPLGRSATERAPAWPHVSLCPLTVGCLEMVDGKAADGSAPCRSAELWVGLAQAAMGRESPGDVPAAAEPALVARAIDEHQHAEAYDQVIVGYLHQIADEVRTSRDPETIELRRRVSTLVSSMHPETLRRLLAMGGDALRRRDFVRAASAGMSAGAVVDLVKAAAEASDEALSTGLVRLLTKLAAHADAGAPSVQPLADSALRMQVARLTAGWDLPDPNPADYTETLHRIAEATPAAPCLTGVGARFDDPLRTLQTCLELDEPAPALWRAVDAVLEAAKLGPAIELLQPEVAGGGLAARVWDVVTSAATLRKLLERVPPDFAALDLLLPHLRGEALGPLFDLLVHSDDRHVRRAAFDRLRRTGADGVAQALARLRDDVWYVPRNLLALLAEIAEVPAACDPLPWLSHSDARVRREALRVALRLEPLRDEALSVALTDNDERVVALALTAAMERPTRATTWRLMQLAGREALEDGLRALAIEALARTSRERSTLNLLLQIAARHVRRLSWPTHQVLSRTAAAALSALATYWPDDLQAAATLRRASASQDPEIRLAAKAGRP